MHRSLLFKLGFVPLVFLIWSWRDSNRDFSYARCDAADHGLTAYHSCSRVHIEFYSGVAVGWPTNFDFVRQRILVAGKSPFPIGNRLFPSPDFQHEVPDLPFERLSEENRFRADNGETSGSLTIPHWLILLVYVPLWLGISRVMARKRRAAAIDSQY